MNDKTVNVSQKTGNEKITVNQPEMTGLTVEQKIKTLTVLQKQGRSTPQQDEQLKDLQDSIMDVNRENNPKVGPKEHKEPDDIFKEKDVLKYMYEDWLLAGGNWLWKKTFMAIAGTSDKLIAGLEKKAQKSTAQAKKQKDNTTTRYAANVDKMLANLAKMDKASADAGLNAFTAKMNRYANGTESEDEKKTTYGQIMADLSPAKRKEACTAMVHMSANANENIQVLKTLSGMLARTQLIEAGLKDRSKLNADPQYFKTVRDRNALMMAQYIDKAVAEGKDPAAAFKELHDNIQAASAQTDKSLSKGQYIENGEKPKDNPKLETVNKALGIGNQTQPPANDRPMGMVEALVRHQGISSMLSNYEQSIANREFQNMSAAEANRERRLLFAQRLAQMQALTPKTHLHQSENANNNGNTPQPNNNFWQQYVNNQRSNG